MWLFSRNEKGKTDQARAIAAAKADQRRAQQIIDHVEGHAVEVEERVGRLEGRAIKNNFGESLTRAMQLRGAETQ